LIEDWFGNGSPTLSRGFAAADVAAAETRLSVALPASLWEWYLTFGPRGDVWNVQDRLVPPAELCFEGERLVVFRENQSVVEWGIEAPALSQDDPPVTVSDPSGSGVLHVDGPSVSQFALQMLARNAKFSPRDLLRANGQITDEAVRALEQALPRLPIADLHWPSFPTRLHGDGGIVVEIEGFTWLWITARDAASFAAAVRLAEDAGVTWTAFEDPSGPAAAD
jgi:hypothetical protein